MHKLEFEPVKTLNTLNVYLASGKTLQVELKEPVKLSESELEALKDSPTQQLELFVLFRALGFKTSIED